MPKVSYDVFSSAQQRYQVIAINILIRKRLKVEGEEGERQVNLTPEQCTLPRGRNETVETKAGGGGRCAKIETILH